MVISNNYRIIETQGTAEAEPFTEEEFAAMLKLAKQGIADLHRLQQEALATN